MATPSPQNVHTRSTFVRNSVEENATTTALIDAIMPYYPKEAMVIGGWVNDSKQYWKANFHWQYLLNFLDKALDMDIDESYKKNITAIKKVLKKNSPSPATGYVTSSKMGTPADSSSKSVAIERWKTVKQCKKDFKRVMDKADLLDGMSSKTKKQWYLAVAPVAKPGTSNHSTGYALDIKIEGRNKVVSEISLGLGATMAYDEASHVHVEFKNGANVQRTRPAAEEIPADSAHYRDNMCMLTGSELAALRHSLSKAGHGSDFGEVVSHPSVLTGILDDIREWWHD